MVFLKGLGAALLTWGAIVNAACPQTNVCITPTIPTTSSQDISFKITAPSTSGWVGFGIGSRMAGALIFVIYPNTDNTNITISPRIGTGNVEPKYESSIKFDVLSGTGIADGIWTANFVCHNCRKWSVGAIDVTSTQQSFIYAIGGQKQNIAADERDTQIQQHTTRGVFSIDLTDPANSDATSIMSTTDKTVMAHGVLMAISWLILFPIGGIIIRFLANTFPRPVPLYLHASLQFFTFLTTIAGAALGIWTSGENERHFNFTHQRLGITVMSLLVLQGPLGYTHHVLFKSTGGRTIWSHLHIWNGRILILLGIVNGGLGLELLGIKRTEDGNVVGVVDKKYVIAYAVVAGVVGLIYLGGFVSQALMGDIGKRGRADKPEQTEGLRYEPESYRD